MGILELSRRLVEDFRGDTDRLASMMQASWGEEPASSFLYTAPWLRRLLDDPAMTPSMTAAIYRGEEIVAFGLSTPRTAVIAGAERRLGVPTLLTVAPALKSSGAGILVWVALMERLHTLGYDAAHFCPQGGPMDRMLPETCRAAGFPLAHARTFEQLSRTIEQEPADRAGQHPPQTPHPTDRAGHLVAHARALANAVGTTGICRLWAQAEAERHLSAPDVISVEHGGALLTGRIATIDDTPTSRWLLVEDVHWGDCSPQAAIEIVNQLAHEATAAGADLVTVPDLGYADLRPFTFAGFARRPHTMCAYLTIWDDTRPPGPPPPAPGPAPSAVYLDII